MKLWAMLCRPTQDWQVTVENFDNTWSTGRGNGKPLQNPCRENLTNCIKRQKESTPNNKPPRPESVQHAPGEERRTVTISSKKNELAGPKRKWHPVVDISGDGSKIRCCKEQYCKLRGMMRDREAWCPAVRGMAKSWTRLGDWTTTTMKLKLRPLTYTEPLQGPVLEFNFVILYLFFQRGSPFPSVLASGLSLEEDKEGDWREERKEEGEKRRGMSRGGETRGKQVSPQRCWLPSACPGIAVQLLGARAWWHVYCKLEDGTVLGFYSIDSPGPCTAPGLEDVEQKPCDREKFPGGLGCYISPSDHSSSSGMPCTPTWSTQNAERGQEFFRPEAECSWVVSRRMVWDMKPPWSHISAPAPNVLLLLKMYTIEERTN